MNFTNNNRGIALLTALMITAICLVIIMTILYTVTRNIRNSGAQKIYRNAVEASYGGADVVANEMIPRMFGGVATARTDLAAIFTNTDFNNNACLQQKISESPPWVACNNGTSIDQASVKGDKDFQFNLNGTSNSQFTVFTKIVSTIPGTQYMNLPGPFEGSGKNRPPGGARHFIYRIEVVTERAGNPPNPEQSQLSVLYEY